MLFELDFRGSAVIEHHVINLVPLIWLCKNHGVVCRNVRRAASGLRRQASPLKVRGPEHWGDGSVRGGVRKGVGKFEGPAK